MKIIFFSGTGNSKYAAERIARVVGADQSDIIDAGRGMKTDSPAIVTDPDVVVCTPVYAWRMPEVLEDWIRSSNFNAVRRIWYVMTCGDQIGDADKYNARLSKDLGCQHMGTAEIIMPENYIAMFDTPEPEESKEIIRSAGPAIEQAARFIKNKEAFPLPRIGFADRIKSGLVNPAFYPLFVKAGAFTTDAECSGCGKCVQVCPLNNVTLVEERPVWGETCTHCMACIAYCPTGAIEYGRKSVGKLRYRCPE